MAPRGRSEAMLFGKKAPTSALLRIAAQNVRHKVTPRYAACRIVGSGQ